jgi:hypothetical protein
MWQTEQMGASSTPRRFTTGQWKMGIAASYGANIARGTVLASFDRRTGRYRNASSGNHGLVFLQWEQWKETITIWTPMIYGGVMIPYPSQIEVTRTGMLVIEQGGGFAPRYRVIPFNDKAAYFNNAGAYNVVRVRKP